MSDQAKPASDQTTGVTVNASERSLLAQFRPDLFVEHSSWHSLAQILASRGGGSYGLAGPRGIGKTWMMEKALQETRDEAGVGVWFPSPSEYEPTAFLAALSDVVAVAFEDYYDRRTKRLTKAASRRFRLYFAGGFGLAYLAAFLLAFGISEGGSTQLLFGWFNLTTSLLLLAILAGAGLMISAFRRYRVDREGLGRVRREAEDLRRQVRFTMSATENSELGLGGGNAGLTASLKRVRQRQLVERPATLSSLIHNFRAFVKAMAAEIDGQVVIAIDELDKMHDATRVAQLFRDIKGIFEIPRAYFLVSLSDEAARALDLGAVRTRNEFNSSFYTVISLRSMHPAECVGLLQCRNINFDSRCGAVIGVLTGGLPREVVRVGELVRSGTEGVPTVSETMRIAMEEELEAFSDRILETTDAESEEIDDAARVAFFVALDEIRLGFAGGGRDLRKLMVDYWSLNDGCPGWEDRLAEEWRRVLVRLGVVGVIEARPGLLDEDDDLRKLQEVIDVASTSAAVGRLRLEDAWRPKGGNGSGGLSASLQALKRAVQAQIAG